MSGIGENIRKLRESAGMSQEQLAAAIGKTRSAVSQYESGKIVPRMGVVEDIAHIFRVSKSAILEETSKDNEALSSIESELLALFRSMDTSGRERLMEQAEFLAARHPLNKARAV